jgi:catechol 2,3-dioxygenase-like lactoylglutathione lyase family enzyme
LVLLETARDESESLKQEADMLGDRDAHATVAVADIARARRFYEVTLGLTEVSHEGSEAVVYATGATKLLVYHSQFAGTSQATAVTWAVGSDVDRLAAVLKAKGVPFERYDMPAMTHEGDVHVSAGMRVAWFRDPDGNIHSLVNR